MLLRIATRHAVATAVSQDSEAHVVRQRSLGDGRRLCAGRLLVCEQEVRRQAHEEEQVSTAAGESEKSLGGAVLAELEQLGTDLNADEAVVEARPGSDRQ